MEEEVYFEIETLRNQIEYIFFKLEEVIRRLEKLEEKLLILAGERLDERD